MGGTVAYSTSGPTHAVGVWLPGGVGTLAVVGIVVAAVIGALFLRRSRCWWAGILFIVLGLVAAGFGLYGATMSGTLLESPARFGATAVVVTVLVAAALAFGLARLLSLRRS